MGKANILFITSATRISGAERVLLFIVENLNRDLFSPVVLLPGRGMLFESV